MAHHRSAIKRLKQSEKSRLRNSSYKSTVKTAIKKYLGAIESKDQTAETLFRHAASLLHKGVSKGIFHANTASRTVSRLAGKLHAS
jgi:small subunit ribosomal protein S20